MVERSETMKFADILAELTGQIMELRREVVRMEARLQSLEVNAGRWDRTRPGHG